MRLIAVFVAAVLGATASASPLRVIESTQAVRQSINDNLPNNGADGVKVKVLLEIVRRSEVGLYSLWIAATERKANNRSAMLQHLEGHKRGMQALLAEVIGTNGMARPALRKLIAQAEAEWANYSKRVAAGDYP